MNCEMGLAVDATEKTGEEGRGGRFEGEGEGGREGPDDGCEGMSRRRMSGQPDSETLRWVEQCNVLVVYRRYIVYRLVVSSVCRASVVRPTDRPLVSVCVCLCVL